jgi:hypothetical protein
MESATAAYGRSHDQKQLKITAELLVNACVGDIPGSVGGAGWRAYEPGVVGIALLMKEVS